MPEFSWNIKTILSVVLFCLVIICMSACSHPVPDSASASTPVYAPSERESFDLVRTFNIQGERWVEVVDPKTGSHYFYYPPTREYNAHTPPVLVKVDN